MDVAAACILRGNTLGNHEYRCDTSAQGELRRDALGRWKDSSSGVTNQETSLGNIEVSDGAIY